MRIIILLTFCCATLKIVSQPGQWTWMHGDNTTNAIPSYGTKGVSSPTNKPSGRYESVEWTDLAGNFWMFGGNSNLGRYNDLWKFNPSTNEWTWMAGTNLLDQFGVYGIKGAASSANTPGARGFGSASWVDNSGNLWLFGGNGFATSGTAGLLNDLWKYDIVTNEWTWVHGPNTTNDYGSYGQKLVSASTNIPRSRSETSATWKDNNGDFWLFGGNPQSSQFNDLWKYTHSNNQWTWMHGDSVPNVQGKHGTLGVSNATTCPGSRWAFAKWQEPSNIFYLYGGFGRDFNGGLGRLADLWKFDPLTNEWSWVDGSKYISEQGNMDSLCSEGADIPSGRQENRAVWKYQCYLIMFGGYNSQGMQNDLWAYNLGTKKWKWLNGDVMPNQPGVYGTKLVSSPLNKPGARWGSIGWKDLNGNFWLFGGSVSGYHNDLWKYAPDPSCLQCGQTTDIDEIKMGDGISISPNPFSESAQLVLGNRYKDSKFARILNSQGKLVKVLDLDSSLITEIKSGKLEKGIYFLQIRDVSGMNVFRKFIVH